MNAPVETGEALRMKGILKAFRGHVVLKDIDWSVPRGSISGLIGPNGAGKTTLLRLALGLLRPEAGTVEVLEQELGTENATLRERVHYVASDRGRVPSFRVDEWLRYSALAYPRWDGDEALRLTRALELPLGRSLRELSSGQRTSFHIAVALAAHPDLLLLDEPTNGLDLVVKGHLVSLIIDRASAWGTTVVIATHHVADVERLADHLAVLYGSRFLFQGGLDDLKGSVQRLQVVWAGEAPEGIEGDSRVVGAARRGRVTLLTVSGSSEAIAARCREAGAVLVEPVALDLAEIFQMMLEREGYSRAGLRSDAG